jgi:hypothetical protein
MGWSRGKVPEALGISVPFLERADRVTFARLAAPQGTLHVALVGAGLDPPCPESTPMFFGDRPEDLIGWLTTRDWIRHEDVRPYNVGRYVGRAIEITVPPGGWTCADGSTPSTAWLFELGDQHGEALGTVAGEPTLVIVFDARGETVTALVTTTELGSTKTHASSASALWSTAGDVLDTIDFEESN